AEAAQAYASGKHAAAREAAITAYLEGFELMEASLANVDPGLMRDIERQMLELRALIERNVPAADLERQTKELDGLLASAQEKLGAGELALATAFTASQIIVLREGIEAILGLAAIIAFGAKSGRSDALPWLHAGWIAALVLGA